MQIYTLEPQDLLFFRDARPFETSGGHGARWPEPSVLFDALHAALWRAFPDPQSWEHRHDFGRSSHRPRHGDTQRFGSLATAGLFPVWTDGRWLFPAPADVTACEDDRGWLLSPRAVRGETNQPASFLKYSVASQAKPSKERAPQWWSAAAWQNYLAGKHPARAACFDSDDLFAGEWTTGIGMDPATQTQDGEHIYNAEYLRLRHNVKCGFAASLRMKQHGDPAHVQERICELFAATNTIIVGGQQRICRVQPLPSDQALPLPRGMGADFQTQRLGNRDRWFVKWILLTPAIWPAITDDSGKGISAHPGGWLPNWVCPETGAVMLRHRAGTMRRVWDDAKRRTVRRSDTDEPMVARLVAACVSKPVPVVGWTERRHLLQDEGAIWAKSDDDKPHGPRATLLAVPAGSVYYFEADSPADAANLAAALNWHGSALSSATANPGSAIHLTRRSTLLGEKGFGLGVCGTWEALGDVR